MLRSRSRGFLAGAGADFFGLHSGTRRRIQNALSYHNDIFHIQNDSPL